MNPTFWRLLRLMGAHKRWIALGALLGFATVGSGVGLLATAAFVIASAALHPSVADLAVAIVGVRFFGIARGVFRYLERYVSHRLTFRLLARLRVWFYMAIEPLAPARLQTERSGDLLARVVSDVETLQQFYLRVLAPPLVALLVALAMWLFFSPFADVLAYALLVFLALGGVALPWLSHRLGAASGREMAAVRGELGAQLVDGIQGMADLVAYGREGEQLTRVATLNRRLVTAESRQARLAGLQGGLSTLTSNLSMWAVLLLAIPLVSSGRLEGVYLPVLTLAALAAFEAVLPLPLAFQHLEHSVAAAGRLFGVVRDGNPSPVPSPRGGGELLTTTSVTSPPLPEGEGTGEGSASPPSLSLSNLRFRYGLEEPWALDGVSFSIPPGGHVAIVGPSGAGKSTIVNLLLRFWDHQEGSVAIDGVDLRSLPADDARSRIAVVAQQTYLFSGTVRDNLLLARPEASEAELVAAAERAQVHDLVKALPRGYDTWIGEQGLRLSGGERQRLAIARALLKDAPILVLDEATANLDSLTEREVLRSLRDLRWGRTTLTITHRLVDLEDADEVIVLSAGRVVERGRHEALLAAGGLYRRMWDLQRESLPEEWR